MTVTHRWRFHVAPGEGGVDLVCQRGSGPVPATAGCQVEDLQGRKWIGRLRTRSDETIRCIYPLDFGAQPVSGLHFVRWYWRPRPEDNTVQAMADPIEFTIKVGGE